MVPDRSIGYTREDPTKPWAPNTDTLPYRGTSAGGGYSTVTDLLRFANALTKHELLDARHTELLTTSKTETPNGGKYGYGFGEGTTDGVRCLGHGGGAPGMNGDLQICDFRIHDRRAREPRSARREPPERLRQQPVAGETVAVSRLLTAASTSTAVSPVRQSKPGGLPRFRDRAEHSPSQQHFSQPGTPRPMVAGADGPVAESNALARANR